MENLSQAIWWTRIDSGKSERDRKNTEDFQMVSVATRLNVRIHEHLLWRILKMLEGKICVCVCVCVCARACVFCRCSSRSRTETFIMDVKVTSFLSADKKDLVTLSYSSA